jgi:hypothetical protein
MMHGISAWIWDAYYFELTEFSTCDGSLREGVIDGIFHVSISSSAQP